MNVQNAKHNHEKNEASEVNASLRTKHQIKFLLQHIDFASKTDKSLFINASSALLIKI